MISTILCNGDNDNSDNYPIQTEINTYNQEWRKMQKKKVCSSPNGGDNGDNSDEDNGNGDIDDGARDASHRRYIALDQKSQKRTKKGLKKGKLLKKGLKKGKQILKKGKYHSKSAQKKEVY